MKFNATGLLVLFASFFWIQSASAAALWLYEGGTPDTGMASAGRAALANDASTATTNPAGMPRLERNQLLMGFAGLDIDAEFNVASATYGGGDGGDAGNFTPVATFHYVHKISDTISLGVTTGSNFGGGLNYDNQWSGRYHNNRADLITFGINPGIGYRVNDWFSIGAGAALVYANLLQDVAVNNVAPDQPDGKLSIDDKDTAFGFNLGMLFEPKTGTRIGMTYRSEVDLEFDNVARLEGVLPPLLTALQNNGLVGSTVNLDMTTPQAVMLSGYQQLTEKLAITGNIGWQEWSTFGQQQLTIRSIDTKSLTTDKQYDDTWHFAVGGQYRIAELWLLSLGFAYDTSPVDEPTQNSPDLPFDEQYRYAAGAQYEWNKDITLGFSYEFVDMKSAELAQSGPLSGDLIGSYDPYRMHVFSMNMAWKF